MRIDWTKPIRTRNGRKVCVLTHSRKHPKYPVVVLIANGADDRDDVGFYTPDGRYSADPLMPDELDLMNIEPVSVVVSKPTMTDPIVALTRSSEGIIMLKVESRFGPHPYPTSDAYLLDVERLREAIKAIGLNE